MPRQMRKPNDVEVMVMNYLINQAIKKKPWDEIDKSFVEYPSVKCSLANWRLAYSNVYHQLVLNPNDTNGYSITPKWVKDIYVEYRNSSKHKLWKPNEHKLESLYEISVGEPEPNNCKDEVTTTTEEIIGWSAEDSSIINILTIIGNSDFKKGYLTALGAKKLYRIQKKEISFNDL